jgi:hypothetical protein
MDRIAHPTQPTARRSSTTHTWTISWPTARSAELESELQRVRGEMASHERASRDYEAMGVQILKLAQRAYSLSSLRFSGLADGRT